MNIGKAIKNLRKKEGIRQYELAAKCKLSINALSLIELNKTTVRKKNLDLICKHLKISIGSLYFIALEDSDIAKNKKEIFKSIKPLLESIFIK